jgi:hypothetical protein
VLAITEPYHTKFRFPLDGTRRHPQTCAFSAILIRVLCSAGTRARVVEGERNTRGKLG